MPTWLTPWRRIRRRACIALVALVATLGAGMLVAALTGSPPQPAARWAPVPIIRSVPAASAAAPTPVRSPTGQPRIVAAPARPRSLPVHITISRIGVDANVIPLGVANDGTLQVPPLDQAQLTGWYRMGPTPGEVGNALIVGHVDSSRTGAAVFYRLGALQPNDTVSVARADGSLAQFTVERVEAYPKTSFPTDLVYGPNPKPGLRLITCGGQFDPKAHSYRDNIIVSATLTSWRST